MNRWVALLLSDSGDEHLLHRLEAFSDVVIGFCLAELAFSLGPPGAGSVVGLTGVKLVSFVMGFFVVSIMWWFHNRLFARFLVLNPVTIVANFAMLGALMIMIYNIQVYMTLANAVSGPHPPTDAQMVEGLRQWLASGAVVYGLLGVMYAIGIVARWNDLTVADKRLGFHRAFSSLLGVAMLIALSTVLTSHTNIKTILDASAILAFVVIASRLVIRRLLPPALSP